MHRLRNDLGSIAVIVPVLRKSAEAGSHSVAAAQCRRALAGAVVMCEPGSGVRDHGHVSVSLLERDVFRLNRFGIPKSGWL
jgi:hypothetical protein